MGTNQRFRFPALSFSVAIQLFVAFFVIYAVTSSGGLEVTDSETRYRTAKSWLAGDGGALSFSLGEVGVPGRNGQQYSFYGPLQSVLMTPFVALIDRLVPSHAEQLFKLVFSVLAIPAISALSLAVLYRALRTFRFSERASFCTVTMIGLATPLWHYGRTGQEENIIGLAFAIYLWGMAQLFLERFAGLKLIALAASIIVATRWSYLPALIILLVPVASLLWQKRGEWTRWGRSLAISAAIGGAVIAAVFSYNAYRFGNVLESGYSIFHKIHPPFFTVGAAPNHIAALLVSPYRGLLWFCPSILILFGLYKTPKGSVDGRLCKATLGAWIATLLVAGSFSIWNAGPAWAPRYIVALIVLLAPAFAAVFATGQRWRAVMLVSFLVQFASTLLPSASEDYVFDAQNLAQPGTCTPWHCECSALCLRGPWALRAISNTVVSRSLPVIDLTTPKAAPGGISVLETSDFTSVFWWPVRAAYRADALSPALAFAICVLVLAGACYALWFFYKRLPPDTLRKAPL